MSFLPAQLLAAFAVLQAQAPIQPLGDKLAADNPVAEDPIEAVAPRGGLHGLVAHSRYDAPSHRFLYKVAGKGHADGASDELPLTWDPELQIPMQRLLDTYQAPLVQMVALDPATGRVLAAIESQSAAPEAAQVCKGAFNDGLFPAASVFKLVTASALLARGVDPDEEICFHGGKHRIDTREMEDNERRDGRCDTLSQAVAKSANVAIAKLAERNLDPVWLRDFASRLLFGRALPGDFSVPASIADIPDEPFAFAQTAAGFGDVRLSAFHGAALAAAIANGGVMVPLRTFEVPLADAPDANADGDGDAAEAATESPGPVQVLEPELAQTLAGMMRMAVTDGTARRAFRFRGAKALEACGKTGSLADKKPFRDYSWFVGFAPETDPKIAVATLVVNGPKWKVHASALAAAAIRTYLKEVSTVGRQLTAVK